MVKSVSQIKIILLVLLTLLCGCTQESAKTESITEPTVTTMSAETTIPTQPTESMVDYSIPVVPDEYWNQLWMLNKRSFSLMFGTECIKETPKNAYAIIQRETAQKCIVFFDENENIDGPWPLERGVFHSNEEILDFILSNPTMDEMSAYDSFRIYIHDLEAHYTQEGVFLIAFPYKTVYIDGVPQSTERCLEFVAYYDYEELITAQDRYSSHIWYILPEDRHGETKQG